MVCLRSGYEGSEGHLEAYLRVISEGHLGSILGSFWVDSGTLSRPSLRNLIIYSRIAFIWPWVGSYLRNMTKYGSWDGCGWVPV